jgi:predicted DNA-binding transcriptional regulator AlpA
MSVVGVSEIAEMLGVSRQRAHTLTGRAGFPAPVVRLKMGAVWTRRDVERWIARNREGQT